MPFAIQYINRPGNGYGIYLVNDGVNYYSVKATSINDTASLYKWLGNGDMARGKALVSSAKCFSMPAVFLNPAQYNSLVAQLMDTNTHTFNMKGN